jgi:hypothetical protein
VNSKTLSRFSGPEFKSTGETSLDSKRRTNTTACLPQTDFGFRQSGELACRLQADGVSSLTRLAGKSRRLLLSLRNLLGAGSIFFLLACGGRLCLFLRRLLARGFRRFVAHEPNAKVHDNRRQLSPSTTACRTILGDIFRKSPISAALSLEGGSQSFHS